MNESTTPDYPPPNRDILSIKDNIKHSSTLTKENSQSVKTPVKSTSEFLCRFKYSNTLPDLEINCKLLGHEDDFSDFIPYRLTDLEKKMEYKIHTDGLGKAIPVDVVTFEDLLCNTSTELSKEDEELIVEQEKSSRNIRPDVSWLRRTEYISSEFGKAKVVSKNKEGDNGEKVETLEERRNFIINSFNKPKNIKHETRPELQVVSILPLVPDFDRLGFLYSHCFYDEDPGFRPAVSREEREEFEALEEIRGKQTEKAMLRGNASRKNESFFEFFLLDESAVENEQNSSTLKFIRDYDFKNSAENSKYFFIKDEDKVTYCPIETSLLMKKKRNVQKDKGNEQEEQKPNYLCIERIEE